MDNGEVKRQTVERQIAQSHGQIARQLEIIEALRLQGYPTDGAERRLAALKHALQFHQAHLARLQNSN